MRIAVANLVADQGLVLTIGWRAVTGCFDRLRGRMICK